MKDNATNVILNVIMTAAPGCEEALFGHLSALVEPTRAEPGCLTYELHRDPDNAAKFFFYERFASQEALDAHLATPHFQNFGKVRQASSPDPVADVVVTKWRATA
jgi:quinol monooxygenase YgiN